MAHGFDYLKKFFENEGFKYDLKDNVFCTFKIQGVPYIAFNNDAPFLQIIISLSNSEGLSREKLLELCNKMNRDKFVTKFTVNDEGDRIWASYEFVPTEQTTAEDFMVIFKMLDVNTDEFLELMKE